MKGLTTSIGSVRRQAGLSQADLAIRAGISRQAYSSIELGSSTPSTDVALRLARELGTQIELLFSLPQPPLPETALLTGPLRDTKTAQRATVYQVGERWLARPLTGTPGHPAVLRSLPVANALIYKTASGREADVKDFAAPAGRTLVAVGCDPSVSVVSAHLYRRGVELAWEEMGSAAALRELADGNAHVAGCHLLDPQSGQYNLHVIASYLPFPATLVTFAVWDQGLVVAPGNPKHIRGVEDLVRAGIAIVNRETGSGSRMLLDESLTRAGCPSNMIAGYERTATSHLSIAEAVGMGLADVGVAVKAAAIAHGLDFVPLGQERYDLVIPNHFLNNDAVGELLTSLRSSSLQRQVEALGGYDVANMGIQPVGA